MTHRSLHKLESYVAGVNVSVGFIVKTVPLAAVSQSQVLSALTKTTELIPVLACALATDGTTLINSPLSVQERLVYSQAPDTSPGSADVSMLLAEQARRCTNIHTHLSTLKAIQYADGIIFILVVNHSITDGRSVFSIVDTFLRCLAAAVDPTTAPTLPSASIGRDLVGELLSDLRYQPGVLDVVEPHAPDSMLKFPVLSKDNVDAASGGCLRVVYRELSEELTAGVLSQCREHGVGFQALLTSVATLALLKLREASGGLDEATLALPIGQVIPVDMRRYLSNSAEQQHADSVTAMASASLPWVTPALQSTATLSGRAFWTEFVYPVAHQPIHDALRSTYLHCSLRRGERDAPPHGSVPYSLVATSVGNISMLQKKYGSGLLLDDAFMQAGFYADSEDSFLHPVVAPSMIDSGSCGQAMVHAYTVFGRLKLSGEYYGYSTGYIVQYFDEIMRILTKLGGGREIKTVGELVDFVLISPS